MGGTAALEMIRRRHAAGAMLGGTSAGTSVMSQTMIAFGNEGRYPRHNLVNLAPASASCRASSSTSISASAAAWGA